MEGNVEISGKNSLFRWADGLRNVRNLLRESRRHLAIAVAFGDFHTFVEFLERARNFPLAEKHTNLAKDAGVELSFLCGIHDGESKRRNSRHDPGWIYHADPAEARLPLLDRGGFVGPLCARECARSSARVGRGMRRRI